MAPSCTASSNPGRASTFASFRNRLRLVPRYRRQQSIKGLRLRELVFAVLGKHGNDHVQNGARFWLFSRRALNQHIFGRQLDFGMIAVDDGRQAHDASLAVVQNRVDGRVTDDWQEFRQTAIRLVERHQLLTIHLVLLIQRNERTVFWGKRLVCEWALQRVQIVRSNRHLGAATT